MNGVIVYWSGSGNTLAMAEAISNLTGYECVEVSNANISKVLENDCIVLGCPAMGAEELEEDSFKPFYDNLKNSLNDKKLLLFGSYGWGDGEWMRAWEEDASSCGANVLGTLIANEGFIDNNELMNFISLIK